MEHKEVFISYHTESSGEAVRKICAALEGAGVSCWYAPRDVEANYAESIVNAIRGCRVFLLLLNEQSNLSAHVLNEINVAFDRFKNHEQITLLPFRVEECSLSAAVYYYLGRIHIMDGSLPPEMVRIQELVDRVCMLLGKEPSRTVLVQDKGGALHSAPASKQYRITGNVRYPDTRFVGRKTELEAVSTQLSGPQNKLLLVGMGGIGKSEIAKMYIKEHNADYDVILWVSFEGTLQNTVASDSLLPIQGISHSEYPEDDQRAYFLRKLKLLKQIADRRVLIIMDNFDVTDDLDLEEFCGGSYGVLFTTRYHQEQGNLPEVEIRGMTSREDLMALFRAEYTRTLDERALKTVEQILNLLEGHPLSIRLVASTMMNRRLNPEKMLELLKTGAAGMAKQNAKAADIIFGHLRQVFGLSVLSEDEQYLLKNLSLISLQGIGVERFFDWCGMDDFDVIDGLIAKSWVIHDPVADKVHLHPLVADLMCEELEKDPDSCNTLLENLKEACKVDIHFSWEQKVALYDLAETLYARLPENHPKRHLALRAAAQLTASMALYEKSAYMFLQILPHLQKPEDKLEIYHKAAHSFVLGRLGKEGRDTAAEGLKLAETLWPEKTHLHAVSFYRELLCRMVEANVVLGEYEEAVVYGRKAYGFCDEIEAAGINANRGWVAYHLARALCYAGHYGEAEPIIRAAVALFEAKNDRWSVNYAYDILGMVLTARGEYEEALALNLKSYEILRPFYGTEHADIGQNLEYRGGIYKAMGNKEKAEGCYRQAIEIYEKLNCHRRVEDVRRQLP